jgi:hypothetical protein
MATALKLEPTDLVPIEDWGHIDGSLVDRPILSPKNDGWADLADRPHFRVSSLSDGKYRVDFRSVVDSEALLMLTQLYGSAAVEESKAPRKFLIVDI